MSDSQPPSGPRVRAGGIRILLASCLAIILAAILPEEARAQATDAEYNGIITAFQQIRNASVWPLINQTSTNIRNGVYNATTFSDIESAFGPRLQASTGNIYDWHRGIDIHANTDDPVVLAYDGTFFQYNFQSSTSGWTMIFRHAMPQKSPGIYYTYNGAGNGNLPIKYFYTFYLHLDDAPTEALMAAAQQSDPSAFTSGWSAQKGTQIAFADSSGESGGEAYAPHLHFECRVGTENSLEYQLDNPGVTQYEFDPHMNPLLMFNPVPGTVMQLETITLPTASGTGRILFSTNPNQPILNRITVTIVDTSSNAIVQQSLLDFNRRTGFDPTTNAALDIPDTTKPFLSPISFGPGASIYKTEIDIPGSWGLFGSQYQWTVTATDIWGNTTSLQLPMTTAQPNPPVVSGTAPPVANSWVYPLVSGSALFSRAASLSGSLSVLYTTGGTAVNGTDYTQLSGTASIADGATTGAVTILPIPDDANPGDKSITLTVQPTLLQDWRFQDANGTGLNAVANSAGSAAFNASIANSTVSNGLFQLAPNTSGVKDSFASIPAIGSGDAWLVLQLSGWSFASSSGQTVTCGFASQSSVSAMVAGLFLTRTGSSVMALSGTVNGNGASGIASTTISHTDLLADVLSLVLHADFTQGTYQIYWQSDAGSWLSIGSGTMASGLQAHYIRLGGSGIGSGQSVSVNRIYQTAANPMVAGNLYLAGSSTTSTLTQLDRDTIALGGSQAASEFPLTSGTFVISRTGGSSAAADIDFTYGGSSGTSRYTATAPPVHFGPAQTASAVVVTPINNGTPQGNQTISLVLPSNSNNVWQDWQFGDTNGTTLSHTGNSVSGGASWNADLANSSVLNGAYRVQRAGSGTSDAYAYLGNRLAQGDQWAQVTVAGWMLSGSTGEALRLGFTGTTNTNATAEIVLARDANGMELSSENGGSGATQIPNYLISTGSTSSQALTLLLEMNLDAHIYRIFYKFASAPAYTCIGSGVTSSDTNRIPYYLHLSALNNFNSVAGEYLDIDRISMVNMVWATGAGIASIAINDRPIQEWDYANFTSAQLANPAISGDTAIPANDGLSNLMKYALGLSSPTQPAASGVTLGRVMVSGTPYMTLQYQQIPPPQDVSYIVEGANILSATTAWSTQGIRTVVSPMPNAGGFYDATATDGVALSATNQRFLRLRVVKSPPNSP